MTLSECQESNLTSIHISILFRKKKRVGFTFYLQLQNNVVYSVRNVGLVPTSSQCLPIVCTYRAVFLTNWIYDGV
jgi:hypothetical protein